MNSHAIRKHQTYVRVRDFGREHAADFAPTSLATQLFTAMGEIVESLETHGGTQSLKDRNARQGTTSRAEARESLRDDLLAMNRTAEAMQPAVPSIEDKFALPIQRDLDLLNAARAFLADATPLAAEFIAREMPADFLEELSAKIQALEDAISAQQSSLSQRVMARDFIEGAIERGEAVLRELNAIVKNKYADNRGILAQWRTVRHTERDPRRSSSAVTTSPATSATPSSPKAAPTVPGSSSSSTSGTSGTSGAPIA